MGEWGGTQPRLGHQGLGGPTSGGGSIFSERSSGGVGATTRDPSARDQGPTSPKNLSVDGVRIASSTCTSATSSKMGHVVMLRFHRRLALAPNFQSSWGGGSRGPVPTTVSPLHPLSETQPPSNPHEDTPSGIGGLSLAFRCSLFWVISRQQSLPLHL